WATARESGWYVRFKRAVIVAGVVACFKSLLITVAVIFDRAPGLVERAVAALIVFITTKIAAGILRDVFGAGAETVGIAGAIATFQCSRLARLGQSGLGNWREHHRRQRHHKRNQNYQGDSKVFH